ncbi:MAG TPA: RT0821/Lpp0805 family surface protein [Rhizomicrobium sp.]|nr:RT0821/Lpp0805 family surface protein [Rhizomicrobium sp.]
MLRGGPFAEFRDGDWEMFRQTVRGAAENSPDGEDVKWSNSKTGTQGVVRVVKRYDLPKLGACRDVAGRTDAEGRVAPFRITLCRAQGGDWRIKPD